MMNPSKRGSGDQERVGTRGFLELRKPEGGAGPQRQILFQVNPESLSRQLSIEQGASATNPAESGGTQRSQTKNAGSLKESFKIQVRLDVSLLPVQDGRRFSEGIGAELAALELLMQPYEDWSPDGQTFKLRKDRPLVIFGWGERRFPVRVTGVTINETFHNEQLWPIRAEVELSLELLRLAEVNDNDTRALLDELANQRRRAAMRLWNPSGQGGR
ncbi:MAG TPA: hypothetical protein PKW90_11285 [Myxococcota bacterium]|nr:hypothetical protein [Myxococcota bacterium]